MVYSGYTAVNHLRQESDQCVYSCLGNNILLSLRNTHLFDDSSSSYFLHDYVLVSRI